MLKLYAKSMVAKKCCKSAKKSIWASVFANNKDAEQPVQPCKLVSALVICLLDIMTKLIF